MGYHNIPHISLQKFMVMIENSIDSSVYRQFWSMVFCGYPYGNLWKSIRWKSIAFPDTTLLQDIVGFFVDNRSFVWKLVLFLVETCGILWKSVMVLFDLGVSHCLCLWRNMFKLFSSLSHWKHQAWWALHYYNGCTRRRVVHVIFEWCLIVEIIAREDFSREGLTFELTFLCHGWRTRIEVQLMNW